MFCPVKIKTPLLVLAWSIAPLACAHATVDDALSALLKQRTQAFSDAGKTGDAAVIERDLDPDVLFTNEAGDVSTKAEMVEGASPPPKGVSSTITVTDWKMRRFGDTAVASFVDVLDEDFHGQKLNFQFRSTEVWRKEGDDWRMVASQTLTVPQDPPAVRLPSETLDQYAGVYQVAPDVTTTLARHGDALTSSTNGGAPTELKAELRDVLFVPGAPSTRKIIQRDASGRVIGYISRNSGRDIVALKIG